MKPVVALVAAGSMGAAVGQRLCEHGLRVTTSLAGRSAATRARATAAGLTEVAFAELADADLFLSIVPPGEAVATAERLLPHLSARHGACLYVDCNAVSPATARRIGDVLAKVGCPYVDAAIIGPPPKPGQARTVLYAAGPDCARLAVLAEHGLDVRIVGSEIGAAAVLKMSYAGITKGLTGLAAAMMLAATENGAAAALHAELARSQPGLLAWFDPQVPAMIPKAYRWDAEMEEISTFLAKDEAAAQIFKGMAQLYRRLATAAAAGSGDAAALSAFLGK